MTKKSLIGGVAVATAFVIYLLLIFNFYRGTSFYPLYSSEHGSFDYEKAAVLGVEPQSLALDPDTGLYMGMQLVQIRILAGEYRGQIMAVQNPIRYPNNVIVKTGSNIIVCIDTTDQAHPDVSIYSYDRGPFPYLFALLFVVLLCAIGGSRGVRSLPGIIFTFTGIILW
jgi:uncharacterized membrane protein